MKRTYTQQPVIPEGYTGRDYNNWAKYVNAQIERILKTKKTTKRR